MYNHLQILQYSAISRAKNCAVTERLLSLSPSCNLWIIRHAIRIALHAKNIREKDEEKRKNNVDRAENARNSESHRDDDSRRTPAFRVPRVRAKNSKSCIIHS